MLNIFSHQKNANQNHSITSHSLKMSIMIFKTMRTIIDNVTEKLQLSYITSGQKNDTGTTI